MPSNLREDALLGGKYKLERVIGRGGMGVVHAARHVHLDRPVAVKLLAPALAGDESAVLRFMSEARAAARLSHPNVVDVVDLDRAADGTVFMVMELLEGETLGARLARVGRLSTDELRALLVPVLDALARAHEAGVVHCDLKPDNVFLARTRTGAVVPKVLDFGIAKLRSVGGAAGGADARDVRFGTPAFMAPEQVTGRKVGPWSDVWSIGVIAFRAATGEHPLGVTDAMAHVEVMRRLGSVEPRPVRILAPDLPATFAAAIDRALARSPGDRFRDAHELHAAIEGGRPGLVAGPSSQLPGRTVPPTSPIAGAVASSPASSPPRAVPPTAPMAPMHEVRGALPRAVPPTAPMAPMHEVRGALPRAVPPTVPIGDGASAPPRVAPRRVVPATTPMGSATRALESPKGARLPPAPHAEPVAPTTASQIARVARGMLFVGVCAFVVVLAEKAIRPTMAALEAPIAAAVAASAERPTEPPIGSSAGASGASQRDAVASGASQRDAVVDRGIAQPRFTARHEPLRQSLFEWGHMQTRGGLGPDELREALHAQWRDFETCAADVPRDGAEAVELVITNGRAIVANVTTPFQGCLAGAARRWQLRRDPRPTQVMMTIRFVGEESW